MQAGIRLVRRRLNCLKQEMASRGHNEVFVSVDGAPQGADVVTVVRGHPSLPSCYVFVTRTAFTRHAGEARGNHGPLPTIRVEGRVTDVIMAASVTVPPQEVRTRPPKGKRLLFPSVLEPDHPASLLLAAQQQAQPGVAGAVSSRRLGPWADDPLVAARARFNHANSEILQSGYHELGGRWWDADQDVINGLACSLDYTDDAMSHPGSSGNGAGGNAGGGSGDGQYGNGHHHHGGGSSDGSGSAAAYWSTRTLGLASFSESPAAAGGGGDSSTTGPVMTSVHLDADRFGPGSVLVFKVRAPRNVALRSSPIVPPTIPHIDSSAGPLAAVAELALVGTPSGGLRLRGRTLSGGSGTDGLGGTPVLGLSVDGPQTPTPPAAVASYVTPHTFARNLSSGGGGSSGHQLLPRTASRRRLTPSESSLALHGPLSAEHHPFVSRSAGGGPLVLGTGSGFSSRSSSNGSLQGMLLLHGGGGGGSVNQLNLPNILSPEHHHHHHHHRGHGHHHGHPSSSARIYRIPSASHRSVFSGPPLSALIDALSSPSLTLTHLNRLLYRCEPEERDDSGGGRGIYVIPGLPPSASPWAGLAGMAQRLRHCRKWNAMGDPLLDNIRAGHWLMDYTLGRLQGQPELEGVRAWLEGHFAILRAMPPGLRPQGFDRVMTAAFRAAVSAAVARFAGPLFPSSSGAEGTAAAHGSLFAAGQHYLVGVHPTTETALAAAGEEDDALPPSGAIGGNERWFALDESNPAAEATVTSAVATSGEPLVAEGHTDPAAPLPFLTSLALVSVQLWGHTNSAPLMALPAIEQPVAATAPSGDGSASSSDSGSTELMVPCIPSLAAGVDHFATGYMRVWGRDTFISLRGLLLATGRYADARATILSFAAVTRHGLLPNLMDGGRNPRFNCRDAAWWFLQSVVDYCAMAPEGAGILSARLLRRFPSDNQSDYHYGEDGVPRYKGHQSECMTTLSDVISEILQKHASGISFREWNAGRQIDAHMQEAGFNVEIRLDPATGLVSGGNRFNCGTWMDKMGESTSHGTDGTPATPRDGADIEIAGLTYSVMAFLTRLHDEGGFPSAGVRLPDGRPYGWSDWREALAHSFERCFWVPLSPSEDALFGCEGKYVGVRGIYRDTYGSAAGWPDYQLRPNQLVAMAVAPQLFTPSRAQSALAIVERQLLGERQLGVKTLDPSDWAYRPAYDNASDNDAATGKGFNYHNGPEWLWPYGYYLRARLAFPPPRFSATPASFTDVTATASSISSTRWSSSAAARRWVFARLARQRAHIEASPDMALPELTQADGAFCRDSCWSQAWSAATVLDALFDLQALVAAGRSSSSSSAASMDL